MKTEDKMKKKKPYLIDNEPVDGDEIIEKAKKYGYEGDGGIFRTSIAAGILRKHGHIVSNNNL